MVSDSGTPAAIIATTLMVGFFRFAIDDAVLQKRTFHKKISAIECVAQATSILGVKYRNLNECKKIVTSEKCKSKWFSKYENIVNNLALGKNTGSSFISTFS